MDFIDRVFLLHKGRIEKFKLSSSKLQSCSDIDHWMLFLSINGIKELNHLELHGCIFKPPPAFDGFNNLKSLDLQRMTFVECTFESIIFSCLLLERLPSVNFEEHTDIKIHALNLNYL